MAAIVVEVNETERTAELDELLEAQGRAVVDELRAAGFEPSDARLAGDTVRRDLARPAEDQPGDPDSASEAEPKARRTAKDKARRSSSAANKAR